MLNNHTTRPLNGEEFLLLREALGITEDELRPFDTNPFHHVTRKFTDGSHIMLLNGHLFLLPSCTIITLQHRIGAVDDLIVETDHHTGVF